MELKEYVCHDAVGLADLVRRRETTADELSDLAGAAMDNLNPQLEFLVSRCERISEHDTTTAPLRGVPFLLKDLGARIRGVPQELGSELARGVVPKVTTDLAQRYLWAGLNVLGRTKTSEFGYSISTEGRAFGCVRNPWDPERTAGGSSGGAAAAVAAGVVPVAHANDAAGSIRIPAAWCGLVGLKPTRMRNPVGPERHELGGGFGVEHVVSRTIRDTAAVLDATCGPGLGDMYQIPRPRRSYAVEAASAVGRLKIAYTSEAWFPGATTDPQIAAALTRTVTVLQDLGHEVIAAKPDIDFQALFGAIVVHYSAHLAASVDAVAALTGRSASYANLEGAIYVVYEHGKRLSAAQALGIFSVFNQACRAAGRFFAEYDVLLTPTTNTLPPRLGQMTPAVRSFDAPSWFQHMLAPAAFPVLFNITGQPAVSLPLAESAEHLPIGMQFVGRFGDEATLLQLGAQLEVAAQWSRRRPPIGVWA